MTRRAMLIASVLVLVLTLAALTALGQSLVELRSTTYPPEQDGGWLLLTAFALLTVLPFVPGLLEVALPRDRYPLPIDLAYSKDPRYMGRHARELLAGALAVGPDGEPLAAPREAGLHEVTMSRRETIEIRDGLDLPAEEHLDMLTCVRGDAVLGEGARCDEDLHVDGVTRLGRDAFVRSLASGGAVEVGPGARIVRWLDADGDIDAARGADLGANAATDAVLRMADGVTFRRLWGVPILTEGHDGAPPKPQTPSTAVRHDPAGETEIDGHVTRHDGDLLLDVVSNDPVRPLVVRGDCEIADGVVFRDSVKVYGGLILGKGSVILGDVFAEDDVVLGEDAVVEGNVFTQSSVAVHKGARVGTPGRRTSLVARKNVTIGAAASIYGYVLTDGEGVVKCDA